MNQEAIDKITADVTKAALEAVDARIDERLAELDGDGKGGADGAQGAADEQNAAKEKVQSVMRK